MTDRPDDLALSFGDRLVGGRVIGATITERLDTAATGDFEIYLPNSASFDLLAEATFKHGDSPAQLAFRGHATAVVRTEFGVRIRLSSAQSLMEGRVTGGARADAKEYMHYLLESSGWSSDRINIPGFSPAVREQLYTAIIPVTGIETPRTKIHLSRCILYGPNDFDGDDVLFHDLARHDQSIAEHGRLKTHVTARSLYQAQLAALEVVRYELDVVRWLSKHADGSLLSLDAVPGTTIWARSQAIGSASVQTLVFCRRVGTETAIAFDLEKYGEPLDVGAICEFTARPDVFLSTYASVLARSHNIVEPLLQQAIRWFGRSSSIHSGLDELVFLWFAIESLANIEDDSGLSKEDLEQIRAVLRRYWTTDRVRVDRVNERLGFLRGDGVLPKFVRLCDRLAVSISKDEKRVLRSSRNLRNRAVHGQVGQNADQDDQRALQFLVSRAIFAVAAECAAQRRTTLPSVPPTF